MKKKFYKLMYKFSFFIMKIVSKINIRGLSRSVNNYKFDNKSRTMYRQETFIDIPISNIQYDVSIIIPIYNREKLANRCLDSVVNQKTKYKYQIILVNDGSTDNSLALIKEYQKKYENVFVIDEPNGGISVARNNGIRAASGDYLAFIDSDDWIEDSYIEKLMEKAREKNADIVRCNHVNYLVEEDYITGYISQPVISTTKLGLNIMNYKGYVWGCVIRRTLFDKIRFPEGFSYEDVMVRYTIMRLCNGYEQIDDYLYYYALHKSNVSKKLKNDSTKAIDFIEILNYLNMKNKDLGIPFNETSYNQLLFELGPCMWLKIRKMKRKDRLRFFLMACDVARENYLKCNNYYKENYYIDIALKNKNYFLWYIASARYIIGIHVNFVR